MGYHGVIFYSKRGIAFEVAEKKFTENNLIFNKILWKLSGQFMSRLSMIIRVIMVLNTTVVVDSDWRFDNLCSSHLQSQSELYHVSWCYWTLPIDLISQLSHNVIDRLSVKPWCYWLWGLVMSLAPFDLSIVTVKQLLIASQIKNILSVVHLFSLVWFCQKVVCTMPVTIQWRLF